MSRKHDIKTIAENISKDIFTEYYKNHTNTDTQKHFNISMKKVLDELLVYYNIEPHSLQDSYAIRDMKVADSKLNNLINSISKEDILKIYNVNGFEQTAKILHLGNTLLEKLFIYYAIDLRDKKTSYQHRSKQIEDNYFEQLLKKISKEDIETIYRKSDIICLARFYHISTKNAWKLIDYFNIEKKKGLKSKKIKIIHYVDTLTKKDVEDAYIQCNGNKTKTLAILKISIGQLNRLLKKFNIQKIFTYDDEHIVNIVSKHILEQLYEKQRLSKGSIEKKLGICPKTLNRLIEIYKLSRPVGIFPSTSNSRPNLSFEQLLIDNDIQYEREFRLYDNNSKNKYKHYQYDFKIKNSLVEINPSITHNITRGIRNGQAPVKDLNYHKRKSLAALKNGYKCIHIWDWTDRGDIIQKLKFNYFDNCVTDIHDPCKYIYDIKHNILVKEETPDTLVIYDDGISYLPKN